ncbi:protein-glutamate O-methyltransferase [Rhodospirillaceae bacterium KN72]|uniref:protein-glutamate O-methyltransferase n=1 Tax=Pacificispira spongiicola TaxID=2729598 RepID=A0A7Y0E350_9PROT|nr:protein-glutamate O-methyltransferase [Pacificispira spongiicola]NMM46380.1 protein-glutamate O-methyltransferase [Pacificispira spongiicola]
MRIEDFDMLSALLKQRSGLVLTKDKSYLLETRLMPVARKHGLKDLDQLCDNVRLKKDAKLIADITEAMTTNESLFFRDSKPFDQFRDVLLPQLMINRASTKKIRIWSAACSSGQEPYSLSMILKENQAKLAGWRFEIVATDISEEMLAKARAGIYTQFEVQRGLPIQMLVKYFKQNGEKWHIDAGLRSMVDYRPFNLLESPRGLGTFDIVFCRNVLIYFDQPTKAKVLGQISEILAKDGVLYLGGAETVLGVTEKFKPVPNFRGMYQHADGTPAIKVA